MDFTAIDFETANRRADSACQLAAVIVRGGRIVDSANWLIRPEPFYFSPSNIQIHGITPRQVGSQPVFGDLWDEIYEKFGDDCLIAHNASFDIGVLLACLRAHRKPIPDLHFSCTRAIARRTWPDRPRFGLKPLAEWLGIRFRHHDALEDSIACAKIMLAAGIDREAESLEDLEKGLRIKRGRAGDWGHRGPRSSRSRSSGSGTRRSQRRDPVTAEELERQPALPFLFPGQVDRSEPSNHVAAVRGDHHMAQATTPVVDLQRLLVRADFIRPLSGKQVVITGHLRHLSRHEAEHLACRLGGICQTAVDQATDVLVVGRQDPRTRVSGRSMSVKEQSARRLRDEGQPIMIVDEDEFLGLVIAPIAQ